jgi:hypothetical protein
VYGFGTLDIVAVLAMVVALIGALTMAFHAWTTFVENVDREGFDRGVAKTESAYKTRDNAKLLAAQKRIQELEDAERLRRKQADDQLAAEAARHQKEMDDAKRKADDFLACLLAGSCRLRDPGTGEARSWGAGNGERPSPDAAPPAGGGDAGSGCVLSQGTAAFLWREAGRADEVRDGLQLCQSTLRVYYQTCTGQTLDPPAPSSP